MKYVVFALLFALVGAGFALQNATAVTVSFALWSFQTSLVLVILGSATCGAMIILFLAAPVQIRLRWLADKSARHAAEVEAKLVALEGKQLVEQAKQENQDHKEIGKNSKDLNTDGI
jgi:uncharacterized integral membrane protein